MEEYTIGSGEMSDLLILLISPAISYFVQIVPIFAILVSGWIDMRVHEKVNG